MERNQAEILAGTCQFLIGREIVDLNIDEPIREIISIEIVMKEESDWDVVIAVEDKTIPVFDLISNTPAYMLVDY